MQHVNPKIIIVVGRNAVLASHHLEGIVAKLARSKADFDSFTHSVVRAFVHSSNSEFVT